MANECLVRANNLFGQLGANLTSSGTTITFAVAPTALGVIDSFRYAKLIVDPFTASEEIIYITSYDGVGTTATGARGQEGTTGVAHTAPAAWTIAPTKADFPQSVDTPWAGNLGNDQEFDADFSTGLPSGWSWYNQNGSTYFEHYGAGNVQVVPSGNNANSSITAIYGALPSTWASITAKLAGAALLPGSSVWAGLFIGDNTGKALLFSKVWTTVSTTNGRLQLNALSAAGGQPAGATNTQNVQDYQAVWYQQIVFVSSTSWRFNYSVDGLTWQTMFTANPSAIASPPTRVGFAMNNAQANAVSCALNCHWLRVR